MVVDGARQRFIDIHCVLALFYIVFIGYIVIASSKRGLVLFRVVRRLIALIEVFG